MIMKPLHANHSSAELPSAFRVISQASSSIPGSIVMDMMPMTAKMANKAPELFGRATEIQAEKRVGYE